MANRTKRFPKGQVPPPASVRSPATRPKPAPATAKSAPSAASVKPNLLRAGLKVLGTVRDDVVQHQSRVFQAILGLEPTAKRDHDPNPFEAVFDQRVARALQHLKAPSPAELRALVEEVAALKIELRTLKEARRKRG